VQQPVSCRFGRVGAGSLAGVVLAVVVAALASGSAAEGNRSLTLSVTATVTRSCSVAAGEALTISCARQASTVIPLQNGDGSPPPTSAPLSLESGSMGLFIVPVAGAFASPAVSVLAGPNPRIVSIQF
jgi:hypothetical protein